MTRNVLSFFAVCMFCLSAAIADEWTLAAKKFDYLQNVSSASTIEEKAAVDLPTLILEKIGLGSFHIQSFDEQIDNELYELQTKRLSLFLQLSREIKVRDELVLKEDSTKKLKKKIAEQETKIKDIEIQIKENLLQAEKKSVVSPSDDVPAVLKKVSLFHGDSKNLYGNMDDSDISIADNKINGLITGNISSYGEYAAVTVELKTYPGARTVGSVVEVGSLHEVKEMAQRIVNSLQPLIANAIPVNLFIAILPEEAKTGSKVFVDGVMQDNIEVIQTTSGEHTLEIESEGYFSKKILYNFVDSTDYQVRFPMEKMQDGTFTVSLPEANNGSNFANGDFLGYIQGLDNTSTVTINGKSVIGQFVSKTEDGKSVDSFYYIPDDIQRNNAKYSVKLKSVDKDSIIEERRLWSYRGYSALMLSLPLTVFAYGKYLSANDGYLRGAESMETVNSWAYASRVASGISLISGGFFLYELVRYLHSASSVLPQYAYEIKNEESEE